MNAETLEYFPPGDSQERLHAMITMMLGNAREFRRHDPETYIQMSAYELATLHEELLTRCKDEWRALTGRGWSSDEAHDVGICMCAKDDDDEETD